MAIIQALRESSAAYIGYRKGMDLVYGPGWGGFHGDKVYRQLMLELCGALPVTAFVETGTFRGYSTELIAARYPQLPVFTSEVTEGSFRIAKQALSRYKNVTQFLDNSASVIRHLVDERRLGTLPLFYLDAHWHSYWPLRDELGAIASSRTKAIIVIDDFEVPGQPQFSYDQYDDEQTHEHHVCNLDYIGPALLASNTYQTLFPRYSSRDAFKKAGLNGRNALQGHLVLFQNAPDEYASFLGRRVVKQYYWEQTLSHAL